MPSYTLEIEAFGIYTANMPSLEIWEDGVLDSTHLVSSSGSTIFVTINYGGSLPTSLALIFNDGFAPAGRTIEIRSVRINDQYVNVGNYLSTDSLVKNASATVDIASSPYFYDASDPALSEFTTGATRTMTAGNDTVRTYTSATPEIFDALAGRDVLYLGTGDDKVFGNAGDDIIYAGAGDDLISGGDDNDRIYGGDGNDILYGGNGNDRIHGQDGNDEIHGGAGNDNLNGHDGNDIITGGTGADNLNGGIGVDYLFGGDDNDFLVGGDGNDTLDGGAGEDVAYGGAGDDIINGGDDNDILIGNTGDDVIHGDDGDDIILGLQDNDTLYGGAGIDTIYGGTGNDIIDGGAGNDTIYATDTNWYDADWGYRQNLTVDSSQVNSDLTDFTLLITEAGFGADFWSNVKADGSDILITAGDGITVLDREVVSIDTALETMEIHVRVPTLSSTLDTSLELYYGNAAVTLSNDAETWNDKYTGVWHLEDDLGSGTTIADSSQAGSDGAARNGLNAADQITGVMGSGFQFNNAEYIPVDKAYSVSGEVGSISVSAWINTSYSGGSYNDNWAIIDFDRSEFFDVYIDGATGQVGFSTADTSSTIHDMSAGAVVNDGTWHQIVAVYDGADKIIYVDGVESARVVNAHGGDALGDNITRYGFIGDGSEADTFDGARNSLYYDGQIDDVRLFEGVLTADEIDALYSSQSAPGTFYSVGRTQTNTAGDDVDTLNGGAGDDTLYASSGGDTLNGGTGKDTLYASSGDDILNGDADNDTLYGREGNNTLNGGDGDDTIYADATAITGSVASSSLYDIIMADNPIGYWRLNETSGITAQNLGSGGSIDGVLTNGVTVDQGNLFAAGQTSMRFDGINDYIHIPDSVLINTAAVTERTVELVFNADITTGRQVLFEEGGGTNALTIYIDSGDIYFNVRDSGEYGPFTISTGITAGVTYHTAVTFDSVTTNLFTGYLNGVAIGTGATATDLDAHSGDIGIGAQNNANHYHDGADNGALDHEFQGRISDVALYNTTLSLADIQERSDIVAGLLPGAAGAVDDELYGGDGADIFYGGEGRDSFVFESASAFNNVDEINNFGYTERDALDISDLLIGYTDGVSDINDFVQLSESGGNTIVAVDANGTVGGSSYTNIAQINNVLNLDADIMLSNENFIV